MKLLHIDSSISSDASASRELSAAMAAAIARAVPELEVISRDLDAQPIPHLDSRLLPAVRSAAAPDGASGVGDSETEVLDEFLAADVVVIGAPMYNFSIPSQLKAWIDRILIAGKTFRYSETGPVGLAGGKRVIIASSRGVSTRRECPLRRTTFRSGICVPSSPSSASRTSRSCVPRASPSGRSSARRR
jgi:FMN-dependent NADH-azoreductase